MNLLANGLVVFAVGLSLFGARVRLSEKQNRGKERKVGQGQSDSE